MKNWIDFRVIAVFHAKGHIVINNKYNVAQLLFLCELLVMWFYNKIVNNSFEM